MRSRLCTGVAWLGLLLPANIAGAAENCSKEQYERDRVLISDAVKNGTLEKGPSGVADSILVEESDWFQKNYLKQVAFMQSYECSVGRGKKFLYLDIRSLSTGKLLATWRLGALEPAEIPNPNSDVPEDDDGVGKSGQTSTDFVHSVTEVCRSQSSSSTFCSCYAKNLENSLSIEELKQASSAASPDAALATLRPKMEAAAKRCR